MGSVIACVKPQEYFKDRVSSAAESLNVGLNDHLEFYLVNLLCDFIAPSAEDSSVDLLSTPLAVMLQKSLEAAPEERFRILKKLGDTSLYIAGFFQDFFNRKAFDITYYISMGSSAYRGVSSLVKDRSGFDQFSDIYEGLSKEFATLVEIVAQVSDDQPVKHDVNVLATYDRWARTDSERLRKILLKQGISPIPTNVRRVQ